jgi:hypothetical protein
MHLLLTSGHSKSKELPWQLLMWQRISVVQSAARPKMDRYLQEDKTKL